MNTSHVCRRGVGASALALALSASNAAAAASFPTGDYAAGSVSMHFAGDGSLRVSAGSKMFVDGRYAVDADRITFTDRGGPLSCAAGEESGTYRWQQTGDSLVFTKLDDRCEGRLQDLTGKSWRKK